MANINVRIHGTANMRQMHGEFAGLQQQVTALNTQLAQMVKLSNGVDARGFADMQRAANANSKAYSNALASSGMFQVQQLKVNRATDEYIKKLQKQQMSFRQMARERKIAARAYQQQLAMENMVVQRNTSGIGTGRDSVTASWSTGISPELDTAGRRLAFLNEELKSGAHQMVNWGKNTQWAGRQLMVGFTMPMAAFGAAAGVMAFQVDKQLTRIEKVYDTTHDAMSDNIREVAAAEKELAELRQAGTQTAINAAREYGSAATDTLEVQAALAAAGKTGNELQVATKETMRIATLGELEYQDAIKTTISLQETFRMSSKELTEAFNYMNAVENATSLETVDFAQAIPIAAGPMKAWGGDIKELGVLLTAMKERGVEASRAANTIKATLQRLTRPSRQIREEWQALTGTSITNLVESSDSLTEVFQKINRATRDLDDNARRKAFAGLFGSYQVANMIALTEGMENLEKGVGQVSAASEIANSSAKDLADTAEKELARQAESVSGKWTRAVEEMKIQISTMGTPFLEFGTVVVGMVSDAIEWFNKLPHSIKTIIATAAGLAAIAGPLLMLAGLAGNLTGNLLKGVSALIGFATKMKLVTVEGKAASLAAEMAEAGYISEAKAVQQLTAELRTYAAAQAEANRMTFAAGTGASLPTGTQVAGPNGPKTQGPMSQTPSGLFVPSHAAAPPLISDKTVDNAEKLTEETKKGSKFAGAMAASTVAMGAGMVLAATSSGGVTAEISKWLMISSVVVPAIASISPLLKSAKTYAGEMAGNLKKAVASGGGLKGILGSLVRGIGPWGLAIAAVTAVTAGIGYWKKKQEEARKEQTRLNKSVDSMAEKYAEVAGLSEKHYKNLSNARSVSKEANKETSLAQQYLTGDMKQVIKDYKSDDLTNADRERLIAEHFMELQVRYGLTAQEAARNIRAMMAATGAGIGEQVSKAEELLSTIGKIETTDMTPWIDNQKQKWLALDEGTKEWEAAGKDYGEAFTLGLGQTEPGSGAAIGMIEGLESDIDSFWKDALDVSKYHPILASRLKDMGITTVQELKAGVEEAGGITEFLGPMWGTMPHEAVAALRSSLEKADTMGSAAIKNIVTSTNALGLALDDDITTVEELTEAMVVFGRTMDLEEARAYAKSLTDSIHPIKQAVGGLNVMGYSLDENVVRTQMQADALKQINQLNRMHGLKEGKTHTEALDYLMRGVSASTSDAAAKANNLAGNIGQAKSQAYELAAAMRSGFVGAVKSSMQDVQQSIADDAMESFDNQMNASLEASQNYWDNRAEGLSNAHENESRALDAKWESKRDASERYWEKRKDAAQKYWENRIKKVDDAIKAEEKAEEKRKKMFEAEIARINKLNEMANLNIDFNVAVNEGNFDEAAKIRNDAEAGVAQTALEAAADAGGARSEARVESLQKQKDRLEIARDAYMKDLERREQAAKRSLEKREQAEKRSLERRQKAEKKALDTQTKNAMNANRKQWESRKKNLQAQLEAFMSFIAKDERQLKEHIKTLRGEYRLFQNNTIDPKSKRWGEMFGERFRNRMRIHGNKLKSDAMWSQIGDAAIKGMLKGMGFSNMVEFLRFVETGEMPKGGGRKKNNQPGGQNANGPTGGGHPVEVKHGGGVIGDGGVNRTGVARNVKGPHSSETTVLAQKGEFMVNKKAAAKHGDLLNAINNGQNVTGNHKPRTGGEPFAGLAGIPAAMASAGLRQGMAAGMKDLYKRKEAQHAAAAHAGAGFGAGAAGVYGDTAFNSEQMKNAAIIASVGSSMGMSARDIMIGIMTAITESSLINIRGGDRDSLGLFQQRPSMGWGTPEQIMNPQYSSRAFFRPLKGHAERHDEAPWLAAQHIQRSAFSDGSNYRKHWDSAQAIFKKGLIKKKNGGYDVNGGIGGGYVPGSGGWHRAADPGKGWSNSHDYRNRIGSPLYAAHDGKILESRAITSGGSPGNGLYGGKYRSYGETIVLQTPAGNLRYAHLNPGGRYVRAGQYVKGGALIGRSGNTGNSSGPHTHFDINGNYAASSWMARHGIALKKGASRINFDNTIANLHKGEAVLTKDLNDKFHRGVENFANGGNTDYTINVNVNNSNASADEIAQKVITVIKRAENRKPKSRRR